MYLFFQSLTDFRANGHNAIQSACFTFLSFISTQPTPIHEPLIPRRASSPNRRILRLQNNCMPKICTYLRMVVPRCNTYSSGLSAHFRPQWAYSRRGERSLDRRPTHFHTHRRLVLRLTSELPSLDLPAYTLTQQFLTVSFHSVTFPSLLRSSLSSRLPRRESYCLREMLSLFYLIIEAVSYVSAATRRTQRSITADHSVHSTSTLTSMTRATTSTINHITQRRFFRCNGARGTSTLFLLR
jgi:hypothetical protein